MLDLIVCLKSSHEIIFSLLFFLIRQLNLPVAISVVPSRNNKLFGIIF